VSAGELNEDILSSLGQLLTSSAAAGANNLGELLKMIPSVSRLSRGMPTASDGRAVKRRRMSTSTLDGLLMARSGDESTTAATGISHHQPALSPAACLTGLLIGTLSHFVLGDHGPSVKECPVQTPGL